MLRKHHLAVDTHTRKLRDMYCHLEDLDNGGRRHNLWLRGLPEDVEAAHLQDEVTRIFNNLLNRPRDIPIAMERIHQALRPKGKDSDPPGDVFCCIVDYRLKEELLKKARTLTPLKYRGSELRLFQDLLNNLTAQKGTETPSGGASCQRYCLSLEIPLRSGGNSTRMLGSPQRFSTISVKRWESHSQKCRIGTRNFVPLCCLCHLPESNPWRPKMSAIVDTALLRKQDRRYPVLTLLLMTALQSPHALEEPEGIGKGRQFLCHMQKAILYLFSS